MCIRDSILYVPKTHKLSRVIKAKAGQTITGKIGGIRKTHNKSIAKPGQTITGKIRQSIN